MKTLFGFPRISADFVRAGFCFVLALSLLQMKTVGFLKVALSNCFYTELPCFIAGLVALSLLIPI